METVFAALFDSDVATLLQRCPWFVVGNDCVLLAVDSGKDTAAALDRLSEGRVIATVENRAIVRGADLVTIAPALFTGFDEVGVFEPAGWKGLDPPELWTSERLPVGQPHGDLPMDVMRVFDAGALRFAADGDGLYVATRDNEELARIREALAS